MTRPLARSLGAGLVALTVLTAPAAFGEPRPTAAPGEVLLEIGEARALAIRALETGQPAAAAVIARALLAHDPNDFEAYLILAAAETRQGAGDEGAQAARKALALARTPEQKYHAARQLASGLAQGEHWTRAQFWLRSAAQHAETPDQIAVVARDYAFVRGKNPLSFTVSASVGPNPNITNASSADVIWLTTPFGTLPMIPTVYSGVTAQAAAAVTFRLPGEGETRTDIGLSANARVSHLDAASLALLGPGDSERDFDLFQVSATLRHLTPLADSSVLEFGANLGRSWYGWAPYSTFASAGVEWRKPLATGDDLALFAHASAQYFVDPARDAVYSGDIGARWSHEFTGGNTLAVTLAGLGTLSNDASAEFLGARLGLSYTLGKPVLGTELSFEAAAAYRDYAFSPWDPAGRQDWALSAGLKAAFPDAAVMGFVPVIEAGVTRGLSNIPAFSTQSYQIGLGLRSQF